MLILCSVERWSLVEGGGYIARGRESDVEGALPNERDGKCEASAGQPWSGGWSNVFLVK